jgi:catechol 2,3-dioxygenase-like lactoylglutathione lyase family enzyme
MTLPAGTITFLFSDVEGSTRLARDRETVERFYEAALASGGRDNGEPGERGYHRGYYAAYVLDPDGNNVEAVHHGPATRSVESVVVTREPD